MTLANLVFRAGGFVAALSFATAALGATFTNNTPITIVDNAKASVYPSVINVPASITIQNICVVLNEVTHARFGDVSILLVAPNGKKIQLMAGTAGGSLTGFQSFSFSDSGRPITSESFQKVAYRPTVIPLPQAMQSPAPGLPYQDDFLSLIGDQGQGMWSLYIQDNVTGQAGTFAGGWTLGINTPPLITLPHSEFVYQGVLKQSGVALSGVYDVQLDLWRNPSSTAVTDKVGTVTSFGVAVENGLFTTRFAPSESVLTSGVALFAEISVRGPGDASFIALSPRVSISAVPLATYALVAEEANFAIQTGSVDWSGITSIPPNVENAFSPWAATPSNGINSTNSGNVLIGTNSGASKLTVNGTIESLTGGVKFPDDTVQTTAAVSPVLASGFTTVDFGSIAAGGEASLSIGIGGVGLALSDVVVVSPQVDLPADVGIEFARVISVSQIKLRIRNHGTAAVDPPSTTYNYRVIR